MELEVNTPKFKIPEFKGFVNPLAKEGMRALAIVLGVIVVIAGIVYAANFGKRTESTVLPAMTEREANDIPERVVPTEISTVAPSVSPSPIREVGKPTGVTVTPAPTE